MGSLPYRFDSILHSNINNKMWDKVFALFDADGSGAVDCAEFCAVLKKHGSKKDGAAEFKKADADGSGEIDKSEFAAMCNHVAESKFKAIDADGSGNISPAELKAASNGVDVTAFLKVADKDGDGEISLSEFKEAIANNPQFIALVFSI